MMKLSYWCKCIYRIEKDRMYPELYLDYVKNEREGYFLFGRYDC